MISRHGESIGVSEMKPARSMSTIPHTRWWMCRSPLDTLPGHHGTLGDRISRALVRMNRDAPRNATNASSAGRDDASHGLASPRLIWSWTAAVTGRFSQGPQRRAGVRRSGGARVGKFSGGLASQDLGGEGHEEREDQDAER